jgi:hypothetical protein
VGAATAATAAADSPAGIEARARAVLADPRYQRALPAHPDSSDLDSPPAGSRSLRGGALPSISLPVLGAGAALSRLVFVVLLVVVVALIAAWIVRTVMERRRGSAGPEIGPVAAPAAAGPEPEPAFEDASRLAAQGQYAEAVHALLLAAIRHFAERSRTAVQPSRTSRELVRLLPLGPETREAFTELVRTVELSFFGGAAVGPEEWERNLARFRDVFRDSRDSRDAGRRPA